MYTFICDALFLYHNKRVNRTCRRVQGSEREKENANRRDLRVFCGMNFKLKINCIYIHS